MEHLNYKELKTYRKNVTQYTSNKEVFNGYRNEHSRHKWYKALMGLWSEKYFQHKITEIHPELLKLWSFNVPYKINVYKNKWKTIDLDAVFVNRRIVDIKSHTDITYYSKKFKPHYYCIINIRYKDPNAIEYFRGRPMIINTKSWDYYLDPNNIIFDYKGIQSKQDVWTNKEFLAENYNIDLKSWMRDIIDQFTE